MASSLFYNLIMNKYDGKQDLAIGIYQVENQVMQPEKRRAKELPITLYNNYFVNTTPVLRDFRFADDLYLFSPCPACGYRCLL
jgi:hypothetical protein